MGSEREAAAASTIGEMATCVLGLVVIYVLFWLFGNARRQQIVASKLDAAKQR